MSDDKTIPGRPGDQWGDVPRAAQPLVATGDSLSAGDAPSVGDGPTVGPGSTVGTGLSVVEALTEGDAPVAPMTPPYPTTPVAQAYSAAPAQQGTAPPQTDPAAAAELAAQVQGYPTQTQSYAPATQAPPAQTQDYPAHTQSYLAQPQAYPSTAQGYPAAAQGYPVQTQAQGHPVQGYPTVPPYPQPNSAVPAGPPATPKLFLPTTLKDSPRFFQVPARRWWWGLIGVVVLAALTLVSMLIVSVVMVVTDPVVAAAALRGESVTTPLAFLWNNISIAFFIPIAVLVSWLFYRQGFGWLVSVTGRARWRWFGLVLGVFIVGYAVNYGISTVVYGVDGMGWTQLSWQSTSLFLIVSVLVTTPFQCAGEEFLFRGALSRLIGGIIPAKWVGLVASAVLSSAAFMALHSASDVWLNINYFSVGLMMWWLAYRTGGLEASIAFHVVNNLFAEISLPFTDISGMFDREAGSASALVLIDLAFQVIMVVIVDILARRWGLVRQSSPAALTPQVVRPKRWFTPVGTLVTEAAVTDLPRLATTVRESPALVQPPMWGYVGSTYPLQTQAYPPQAYPPPSAQVYPPPSGTPAWPAPGIAPAAGYATPPPAPTPAPTPTPMHTPTLPLAPTPMHTPTPSLAPTPAHAPTLTPTPTPVYTPTPPPAPGQSPWVAPPPGSVPPWATPAGYPPSTDGVSPGPDTISPSSPDLSSSTDGNPPPRPAIPPRSVT